MLAPAAMMIEAAADQLKDRDYSSAHRAILDAQLREVCFAIPGCTADFCAGYQLGLQAARVVLSGMPAAVMHKVEI